MNGKKNDFEERPEERIKRILVAVITLIFLLIVLFVVSFFFVQIAKSKPADQITYNCERIDDFTRGGAGNEIVEIPGSYVLPNAM